MTLAGDNGLLNRTVGAKNKTKLAEAQEIANLEYSSIDIDRRVNSSSGAVTAESIATALENKGFETHFEEAAGATLEAVALYDGETAVTSEIKLKVSDGSTTNSKNLKVKTTTTGGNGTGKHYVIIDGLYYEIIVGNGVTIDKEGKTEASVKNNANTGTRTVKMTISGLDSTTTIQKKVVNGGETTYENITAETTFENNDEIKITAGTAELSGVTIIPKVVEGSTEISVGTTVGVAITAPLGPTVAGTGSNFSTGYGTIEVVWLDQSNNIISSPLVEIPTKEVEENSQIVTQNLLTPIKLNADGTYTENPTGTWYNYVARTGTTTSEWANAINPEDGSFFVWIPRYAYRITYYASKEDAEASDSESKIKGYYDGHGMWNKSEKKVVRALESSDIKTVDDGEKTYIVHPAFEVSAEYGGGFSTNSNKIAGIWVAKYEMSMETSADAGISWIPAIPNNATAESGKIAGNVATVSTGTNRIRAVSKPCTSTTEVEGKVSSWRYINIANCYTNSYNYNRDLESHLMKNSEWGAVAYLAHSQYGLNGEEIAINNSSDYYTGNSGGSANASSSGTKYAYNTANGVKASTTENISGIYDLSGGAFEYVAGYNNAQDSYNYITKNGWAGLDPTTASTKYATQYINNSNPISVYTGDEIYNVGKIGDATKEVYTQLQVQGSGLYRNWLEDYSSFVEKNGTFFLRGSAYDAESGAGLFSAGRWGGKAEDCFSYRLVLAP